MPVRCSCAPVVVKHENPAGRLSVCHSYSAKWYVVGSKQRLSSLGPKIADYTKFIDLCLKIIACSNGKTSCCVWVCVILIACCGPCELLPHVRNPVQVVTLRQCFLGQSFWVFSLKPWAGLGTRGKAWDKQSEKTLCEADLLQQCCFLKNKVSALHKCAT